jgi:lysophospholipase L1-like esterase
MGAIDGWDGIHFTPEDHTQLGRGLVEELQAAISD